MKKNHCLDREIRIAVVGTGMVGSSFAYAAMIKGLAAELILVDVSEEREEGEVMDLSHGLIGTETPSITPGTGPEASDELINYIKHVIQMGEGELGDEKGEVLIEEDEDSALYQDAADILSEYQIGKDIKNAIMSFGASLEGEKRENYLELFSNLKKYAVDFNLLKQKTKSDLFTLRDQIYEEIKEEISDYYVNILFDTFEYQKKQSEKFSFGTEGILDDVSGLKLEISGVEWRVFSNKEQNEITKIEKDGKQFIFKRKPSLDGSLQYLRNWQEQENSISTFNEKVEDQYKIDWKNVKGVTLVNPGFWQFKQGGRLFMVTRQDVLIQGDDRVFDPLDLKKSINIDINKWGGVHIQYKKGEMKVDREINKDRDSLKETFVDEEGNKIIKVTIIYKIGYGRDKFINYYRLDEYGYEELFKSEKILKLYGQTYYLDKTKITFDKGKRIGLLDVDPEWNQEEKERQAERYLEELAQKLDTPEKLGIFIEKFFQYTYDSPDPDNPALKGLKDDNLHGDHKQTAIETVLRREWSYLLGDCDDYAMFAREILMRNENVVFVHTLGIPGHATCLWVEKTDKGYLAATLGTFGLDKQEGATIEEAYSKVIKKFKKGGLGLEGGAEFDETKKEIEILYNIREGKAKRIFIPKEWLKPESPEGQTFFNLTRAIEKNDYKNIIKYADELAKLSPEQQKWRDELYFDAILQLGQYEEGLKFIREKGNQYHLAKLMRQSNFSIFDEVAQNPLFPDFDAHGIYADFLIKKGDYKKAYDVMKSKPDYQYTDLLLYRDILPHLDIKIATQEIPKDITKIEPHYYGKILDILLKTKDPFADELLEVINKKVDKGGALMSEDIDYMMDYYEKNGDEARLLKLTKRKLESLEKKITSRTKYNPALSFYELAAQKLYYEELSVLYTSLKMFKKLQKLYDARKLIEPHITYYEKIKNNPDKNLETSFGYVQFPKRQKRIDIYYSEEPTKLTVVKEHQHSRMEKRTIDNNPIPIIKITKNPDPDGYHWAHVSPHAQGENLKYLRGAWIRIDKSKVKIEKAN